MDIRIKDGDVELTQCGEAQRISGAEQALQQVMMCILTPRGSFIYDKDMGCMAVCSVSGERECLRLEAQLKEAASPVEGARVYLDSAEELVDGSVKAQISVSYGEEILTAEVIL